MAIKLELELDYTGVDGDAYPKSITDAIIDAAAAQLLDRLGRDELYGRLRSRVSELQNAAIQERIQPLVTEALGEKLQPTDEWGKAKGEPLTLQDLILKRANEYLTTPVGDFNKRETPVQKFVREEVQRTMDRELRDAMNDAKAQVVAAVKEQGAEVLANTIAKFAGVR